MDDEKGTTPSAPKPTAEAALTEPADADALRPRPPTDVGPDPVWGVGLFVLGVIVMATGGATTRHYMFNVGEGILLIGVAVFVGSVALTSHRQENVVARIKRALKSGPNDAADG